MISYNKRAVTALLLSERKTMKSKVLAILTLIFALCICTAYADGVNVDSGIKYVSQSGATIRAFPDVSGADYTMYASANIKNESGSAKDMIMFASIYDGSNNLKKVIYEKISVPEYDEKTIKMPITIPQGTSQSDYVCKAFLWDSVIGEIAYRTESVFLDFGTSLYGITIDGADIENYSDATDFYSVQISKANSEIKVYPKSGATNIQYSEVNVPGTSKVLLASGNNKREITIKTYLDDSDTYTLSSLKYKIGNTEYAIEGFDSEVYEYTVNLPDNTFYVALLPEAMGEITCTIQDINDSPNIINGVSFGKLRTDTTGPAYVYERKMIDGIVPIKNECTKAIVNVTDGENTAEYVINFKAVQPRLTEYNLVGADGDNYVPVFTSGAGLNNDNGSICAADRIWAAANISKKLVGASYFMSPYNNKGNGQWWNDVGLEGDEYFNFTADTAGTIYMMTGTSPSAYADWTKVNDGISPGHPDGFTLGDKTWNDYEDTDYFMSCVKWNSNTGRCDECGVGKLEDSQTSYIDGTVQYKHVFAKHFEAGEKVSVKHTGLYGNGAAEIIWAIVWDVDVNYPTEDEGGSELPGDEEEIEEGLVLDLDAANNSGEGILDEFTSSWLDLSKNGNDVALTDASEWGSDALWITNGSRKEADAVLLSESVDEVINSYNFTVEFDLESLDSGAVVAASKNEEFSICEERDKLAFYFAGIVRNTISVALDEALSGYNQIAVSCDASKNITLKWYIDGALKAEKSVSLSSLKTVDQMMLGSYNRIYSGKVAIKKFKVFDYTKTVTE